MTTIPIQLKDAEIHKIDYLVKIGKYKSRNQALKQLVEESLSRQKIQLEEEIQENNDERMRLFELLDRCGGFRLTLTTKELAADLISKE